MKNQMKKTSGTIEAVAKEPSDWNGQGMQIGFKMNDSWFNVCGKECELLELKKTLLKKGNEIEFESDGKKAENLVLIKESANGSWTEDIVNFETLLHDAHIKGLDEIKTECLTVDLEKKYALFKCIVHGKKGFFEAHGDATIENVGSEFIKPHFIRLAETRSICRALRWYGDNAAVAEEEKA